MKGHQCGRESQVRNSLHLEVVGSQFCVVDVQDRLGVEPGGDADLWRETKSRKFRKCKVLKSTAQDR